MLDRIKNLWYLVRHVVGGYHNWKHADWFNKEYQCTVCKKRITITLDFILPN